MTPEDVVGVQTVNGFYGPGAWAGLVIAMTSVWYSTFFKASGPSTSSILAPVLYISWAAIDLLIQMESKEIATDSALAALTTTFWGMIHLLFNYVILASRNARLFGVIQSDQYPTTLPRLSCVLPWIALMRCAFIPDAQPHILWKICIYVAAIFICFPWMGALPERRSYDYSWFGEPFVSMVDHLPSVGISVLAIVLPAGLMPRVWDRPLACFLKPCTPQTIGDSDQAFSILVGLMLFVYEVGPDALVHLRKMGNRLHGPVLSS